MRAALLIGAAWAIAWTAAAQQPFDLDTTFRTVIDQQYIGSVLPLDDGDVIISGQFKFPGDTYWRGGARLNSDGSRDTDFAEVAFMGGKITPWNGRMYVGNGSIVRRCWLDGSLDTDFILMNSGPYFLSLQGGDYYVYPDGRVLMCGLHHLNDTIRGFVGSYTLIWFSDQGYLDTTRTHRQCNGIIYSIHPLPDGKFICSGFMTQYDGQPANGVIRIQPNGDLDTTFHTEVNWGWPFAFHLQDDGKLLCAGSFKWGSDPDTLSLVRLLPNGDLDPTFNNHIQTLFTVDNDPTYAPVSDILPLGNDRWIITGSFDRVEGAPRGGIALIDTAGNLSNDGFTGNGCGLFWNGFEWKGSIRKIVPTPDGSFYVHGGYHGYDDGTTNDTLQRMVSRLYGLDVGVQEQGAMPSAHAAGGLTIHPNPASSWVGMDYDLASAPDQAFIRVRDLVGRVIFQADLPARPQQVLWDSRSVPSGVYSVELWNKGYILLTQKLVIQQ